MTDKPCVRTTESGQELHYFSRDQLLKAWADTKSLKVLADGCRLNALTAIQAAGSGHIGTSFSSLDIMVAARHFLDQDDFLTGASSHVFFSSKGHDAPAYYATMHLCGELGDDDLFTLRRLGGLPGHPETITPGVPTNTGSLGMGISKAKGFIKAQRLKNPDSREPVVVVLGDGELNEGQIWESMPGAVRDGFHELIAIVDANHIQSDTWTDQTLPMGDMRSRVEGAGWSYLECEGNDPDAVTDALEKAIAIPTPTLIYARTTKGYGVPWMEAFPEDGEYYKFHSGALAPEVYQEAAAVLVARWSGEPVHTGHGALPPERPEFDAHTPRARADSMLTLWEKMLCDVMAKDSTVIALDGDLSYDTGTHLARHLFPERYIQAGIAEQDMVSMAGTLALSGYLPIVHSFATFLTMRGTEQIFNNATEYTRVVYFGFLAGLVPSAPGFSHQAVTDVGIMSSLPGMRVFEPSCEAELAWAIGQALQHEGPSYLRMGGLAPLPFATNPVGGLLERRSGSQVAMVASGPLLAHQALEASEILGERGIDAAVFTLPEITGSLEASDVLALQDFGLVAVLENHNPTVAKHALLTDALPGLSVIRIGLDGVPANGQPVEVLAHHHLDAASIADTVESARSGFDSEGTSL
jgi:transketolase